MAFTYQVIERIGTVAKKGNNNIELRRIAWNGAKPKYDIRPWYEKDGEERCAKGLTLDDDDLKAVHEILRRGGNGEFQKGRSVVRVKETANGNTDIRAFIDDRPLKGVTIPPEGVEALVGLFDQIRGTVAKQKPVAKPKVEVQKPVPEVRKLLSVRKAPVPAEDSVVHALATLPATDSNYPVKTATAEQLQNAIAAMEAAPDGNKSRLAKCKARLRQLQKEVEAPEKSEAPKEVEVPEKAEEIEQATPAETAPEEEVYTNPASKVIRFPKKDTEAVTKLAPTGEGHTYEECVEKLEKEREMFQGDAASSYVIDGILEACRVDAEFRDNVMRPEKSYAGAFRYFANKARAGYCTMVDGIGVMDADTALRYAIDYFGSEEPKRPEPKETPKKTTKRAKATKKATKKAENE